jgi:hypothetical protein
VVTYIQPHLIPHHILRGLLVWSLWLAALSHKEGEMATSSLILADNMGPASQENTPGTGHFLD